MSDLLETGACDLARALATRRLTCEALMAATLERIEAVNPLHNAIVALRPRADLMAEARAADREGPRGPLHGLPMAVKDLEDVAGLPTTRARRFLAGRPRSPTA